MNVLAALANLSFATASLPGERRFRRALDRPERVQAAILAGYLRRHRDTAFGRRHGFARIRSAREFQERVPLTSYDDYAPWIERIAGGEDAVLTREPVQFFELSSGSTRAAKWIPFTAAFQTELRRALAPWLVDLMRRHPALIGGPAYWSITPPAERTQERASAIPVGVEEDAAYLGGALQRVVDRTLVAPAGLRRIRDPQAFRRATRVCLLRCRDLRLLSVWHPSFLTSLFEGLEDSWGDLVRDVAEGLRWPAARFELAPDRRRARELEALAPADLSALWPRLAVVSCWGEGHAAGCLPELRRRFPGAEIQPKGLLATEAWVSIPFRNTWPLALTSHFFELLEADGKDETDGRDGTPRLAHEVEVGRIYSVVVTTGGGLYRYRLHDRVEVTGFLGATPCLRFVGKEDRISDLCGEKLSEGFVAGVVEGALAAAGVEPRFALLAPETTAPRPRYVLFVESTSPPPAQLALALDRALRDNPHYRHCIELGQLAPAEVAPVAGDAWQRYALRLTSAGQRLGDVKPSFLSQLGGWREVLTSNTTGGSHER